MEAPSSVRNRYTRRLALVAVAGVGAATLVACEKPLPDVTFQSGSRSVISAPTDYCFDSAKRDSCRVEDAKTVTLQAAPGGSINVSVPRTVALNAWIVTAKYTDASGQTQAIDGIGSNPVVDNHHTRVPVPNIGVANYQLTVTEFRGTTATGAWTIVVDVTG